MSNVYSIKAHLVDEESRLIDEMALALLGGNRLHGRNVDLSSDAACILALIDAGFRGKDIGLHLDAARDLARAALAEGFSEPALP